MLVKLWTIPDDRPLLEQLAAQGIEIRRALAPEKQVLSEWVRRNFADPLGERGGGRVRPAARELHHRQNHSGTTQVRLL